MLCDPPPANAAILPQPRQGSYFFNRIGHERPFTNGCFATVYALFDAYIDDANLELTQVLKQD